MYAESYTGDIDQLLRKEQIALGQAIAIPDMSGRSDTYGLTAAQREMMALYLCDGFFMQWAEDKCNGRSVKAIRFQVNGGRITVDSRDKAGKLHERLAKVNVFGGKAKRRS